MCMGPSKKDADALRTGKHGKKHSDDGMWQTFNSVKIGTANHLTVLSQPVAIV